MLKTSHAYSKAAFDYALAHNELETWYDLCKNIQNLSHPAFANPTLPVGTLELAFEGLTSSSAQKAWLSLMMENHHLKLLGQISKSFLAHYNKHLDITPVEVTTATELTKPEQTSLISKLKNQLKTEVDITFKEDPSIIGGVQLKIYDKLIDQSLALVIKQLHSDI